MKKLFILTIFAPLFLFSCSPSTKEQANPELPPTKYPDTPTNGAWEPL